jgi:hypothetical protein
MGPTVQLVLCSWEDHSEVSSFATDIPTWFTLGFLVYEDDKQIHLLSAACLNEDDPTKTLEDEQITLHRVLKSTITMRVIAGTYTWPELEAVK